MSLVLDERPVVQLRVRLTQLVARVHDNRTLPRDRFLERFARYQQEPDSLGSGLDRNFIPTV